MADGHAEAGDIGRLAENAGKPDWETSDRTKIKHKISNADLTTKNQRQQIGICRAFPK